MNDVSNNINKALHIRIARPNTQSYPIVADVIITSQFKVNQIKCLK